MLYPLSYRGLLSDSTMPDNSHVCSAPDSGTSIRMTPSRHQSAPAFEQITSQSRLDELCDAARDAGRIAIDTEFLWEKTYAPLICLAQLNVDGHVAIADPIEGIDLTPLASLVADPAVQVVMHAPHADLVAFALRHDVVPTNIFDTQLAAGFIGLSAGLSYERLVAEVAGARVQPSESFTDWSRRPLNARQLRYAGEDVEHLFTMTDAISDKLHALGRTSWAHEELSRRFEDPLRITTQPDQAWRKVSRRGKLGSVELAVLREAAAWRERTARRRDIPTSWVMKDPTIVEIARRKPVDARDLMRIRGIDQGLRHADQQELITAVARGCEDAITESTPSYPRSVRRRINVAKGLATALLRARCEGADMAPELVGTSSDVEELIAWVALGDQGKTDLATPALMQGWRQQFGTDLVDLVAGRISLALSDADPYLVIQPTEPGSDA